MLFTNRNVKRAKELILTFPNQIYLFDIDNTLFISNLLIYYKLPGEKEWKSFPCTEWKEFSKKLPKETEYDFREFFIYLEAIKNKKLKPNINVLKIWDLVIQRGKEIGIWTSRNLKIRLNEIYLLLKWRNENNKLLNINKNILKKENIIHGTIEKTKSDALAETIINKYDLFIMFDDEIVNYDEISEYLIEDEFIYVDTRSVEITNKFYELLLNIL